MKRRVVITGIGALTPIGNDVPTFWSSIIQGKSGAAPITKFDTSKFRVHFACELKGYNSSNFFDSKENTEKFKYYEEKYFNQRTSVK